MVFPTVALCDAMDQKKSKDLLTRCRKLSKLILYERRKLRDESKTSFAPRLSKANQSNEETLMSDALFGGLMLLGVLSVPAAVVCAASLYREETTRVGCFAYGLILLISAVVAYLLGLSLGINLACVQYPSGNLCGLFGFIATGTRLIPSDHSCCVATWPLESSKLIGLEGAEPFGFS